MAAGTFGDQLRKFFKSIKELSGGIYQLERDVVDELLDDGECIDRLKRAGVGETTLLDYLVEVIWDERFENALHGGRLDPPRDAVLCGFGEVCDRTLTKKGFSQLIAMLKKEGGFDVQGAIDASSEPKVEREVLTINDVVGSLIRFRNPNVTTENKTRIADTNLLAILRGIYDKLESQTKSQRGDFAYSSLGGVPAIMADALAQLGLPNVSVLAPYHADSMASLYRGQPSRLNMKTLTPDLLGAASGQEEPVRTSYIAAYGAGHEFEVGGTTYRADTADRAIFRVSNYVADVADRKWDHICIEPPDGFNVDDICKSLRLDEWPFFPFFHWWEVERECLTVHVLGQEELEKIGRRYTYVLLNTPRMDRLGKEPEHDTAILLKQLHWLADVGARLHLEVSGVDSPETIDIASVRNALSGVVRSMGINDKELLGIVRAQGFGNRSIPPIQPYLLPQESEIIRRYQAALYLCYELDLERLYVHANDLDLILRRDAKPTDLRNELQADLLAKWVVVLAAIQRRHENWEQVLKDWETHLEDTQNSDSSRSARFHPLSPHLLATGFRRLIELFTDLATIQPALRDAKEPSVEELLLRGYWLNCSPGGYSVVGVPVMWPNLPIEVNTTGAGDLCSGISAVYAGF